MVGPDSFMNNSQEVLSIFPSEVASQIVFWIQALGGLLVVYLIFLAVRIYMQRNQMKMIREMRDDIKAIKRKVKMK